MTTRLADAWRWITTRVDIFDLVGLAGAALAFNGAELVFGTGAARLGLGVLILVVYAVREFQLAREGKQ